MNKNRMQGIAKNYPNQKEFYNTSDGQTFLKEDDAYAHASSLEDQNVETIDRKDIVGGAATDESSESVAEKPAPKKAAKKASKKKAD